MYNELNKNPYTERENPENSADSVSQNAQTSSSAPFVSSETNCEENKSENSKDQNYASMLTRPEEPAAHEYTPQHNPHVPPVYSPSMYGYRPVNMQSPGYSPDTVKKKEKKPVTAGVVIAVALICAILASTVTSMIFVTANNMNSTEVQSGSASSAGGQTVNITTSDSATTAEAVAAKCSSSIVGIRVTTESTYWSWYGTQTGESYGEGTGVIYSSDGYIITNYHVISSAVTSSNARLEVFFGDDTENGIPATLVGYVVSADIAVIKIDKTGLTPIEIGDSDTLVLGQKVLAIGNPGGIKYIGSISEGIISGLNRQISIENIGEMTVIQTDAAINPGNSGGALVNSSGKLIGVVSSKIVSESYEGIGFAIPSNTAVSIAKEIIENPESRKPYVGVTISASYDSETLNKMGYPSGVVVESVTDDGPAATAGIKRGDIITAVGDTKITSYDEFSAAINNYRPGVTITLTVYRSGRNYQASVTLGETN